MTYRDIEESRRVQQWALAAQIAAYGALYALVTGLSVWAQGGPAP